MAVQLPDFTALSGQPTGIENVPPGDIRPSYPREAPEAEALAQSGAALGKLGGGLQTFGTAASALAGQQQSQVNLANAALAQMDLHTKLARNEAAIKAETDPAKIDQLYSEQRGHLESAAQLIPDEGYRALWKAKHTAELVTAELGAEAQQRKVYGEKYLAGANQQIETAKQRYAQSDDPAVRAQALTDLGTYYGSLKNIGLNPVEVELHERKAAQDMILGRSEYLYAQNRPKEALDNLTANLDKLPDTARVAGLAHTLRTQSDRADVKADIDREWGGADKGYAGARRPGGGEGPVGPPPTGPVDPAQYTNEANKQGVDPRLVHATADIESSYGTNTGNKISPSNTGIFQRAKADAPGGMNDSYENQIRLGVGDLVKERDGLRQTLGREPTNAEVYLAHQQGVSGATKLINNPTTPAGQLVPPINISNNAGDPNKPASAFVAHWQQAYDRHEGKFRGMQFAAATPTTAPGTADTSGAPPTATDATAPAPLSPATIQTFKDAGMSDAEIARVQAAPSAAATGPAAEVAADVAAEPAPAGAPGAPTAPVVTAAAPAGATAVTPIPPAPPAAQPSAPAFPPLPDIEAMQQRVQDRADSGEISQDRANAVMAGLKSRFNHLQGAQAADKAALERAHVNTVAALIDGKDVDYNPSAYRHFFPAEQAAEKLQQLQDAKDGGRIIANMRTSSPAEIEQQRAKLAAGLNEPGAPDYAKRHRMLQIYDQALTDHEKNLIGPQADPIAYLGQTSPVLQQAQAALDPKQPATYENFANTALSEQTRLGVPLEKQRLLSNNAAQRITLAIGSDPEHAPDVMRVLAAQYGQAWPHVWSDLITAGKLPSGYQVVGQLADYDQQNAAILSRALGAKTKDDAAFEKLVSSKAPGGKSIKDVANETIPTDQRVLSYEHSLLDSGASAAQTVAIRGAIEHLAAGRAIFLHEDPSEAAQKAIDSVIGHYEFMPNGGARVPADRFSDTAANAQATLNGLSLDNVTVPPRYTTGVAGEPKPQDYIDSLKAAPTWITGPKADRLVMMDPGGRVALDQNGQRIEVPFAMPGPVMVPPPQITPFQVPY